MRPYRREKVASRVHTIIGEMLVEGLNDPRIGPLTTVTRVEMSGDLAVARVFISVAGEAGSEKMTLQALQHAAGHFRRVIAQELPMRTCPEIRFEVDESAKKARETMRLLEENRRKNPAIFESPEGTDASEDEIDDFEDSLADDDEFLDDDDSSEKAKGNEE